MSDPLMTREEVETAAAFFDAQGHPGAEFREHAACIASGCRVAHALLAALDRIAELEQRLDDPGTTHADGCHAWGPKHYGCAEARIGELERMASAAVAACHECGEVRLCDEDGCCLMCGTDIVVYADRRGFEVASERIAELEAQVARLSRVLAVERGDESQAPDGWSWTGWRWVSAGRDVARKANSLDWIASRRRKHQDRYVLVATCATALEAMEAADEAAKESR